VTAYLFAAFALSCGTPPSEPRPRPPASRAPLVVIGIDGATFHVADPLLDRGELPTLASLRARGVHGVLESFAPAFSPVIWTTIVTGVSPERHGVQAFLARVPGRPQSTLVPSTARRVPALWTLASAAGLSVGVVSWWATWPAERVRGFVVADTLVRTGETSGATHPSDLVGRLSAFARSGPDPDTEIRRILGREAAPCPRWSVETSSPRAQIGDSDEAALCVAVRRDLATIEIARALARETRPDALFVYLKSTDIVSHLFWRASFPGEASWRVPPGAEEIARYGRAVPGTYRFADALVGHLLEGFGRANVVVLSDHGFRAEPASVEVEFRYDELLARMGLFAGTEGDVDWSRTIVLHDSTPMGRDGELYLNLRERSPQGIVPAAEYLARAREIASRMRALRTVRGRPLFSAVTLDESAPLARASPDVRLVLTEDLAPDDEIRMDGRRWPLAVFRRDRKHTGDHMGDSPAALEGVVFAAGPDFARRPERVRATVYDVAPTLACLLHVAIPGPGVREPSAALLASRSLEGCGAWEAPRVPTPAQPGEPPATYPADDREREELRALGYVE
jgi:predicted AlkP superfamily phosphohydrolase/phosphomutase